MSVPSRTAHGHRPAVSPTFWKTRGPCCGRRGWGGRGGGLLVAAGPVIPSSGPQQEVVTASARNAKQLTVLRVLGTCTKNKTILMATLDVISGDVDGREAT